MPQSSLYVVGVKGEGVLFVRTNPFRAVVVSDESIRAHDEANPGCDGYDRMAEAAKKLIASAPQVGGAMEEITEDSTQTETQASAVDFAFFSPVDETDMYTARFISQPLSGLFEGKDPATKSGSSGVQQLSSIVMNDTPDGSVPDWSMPEQKVA